MCPQISSSKIVVLLKLIRPWGYKTFYMLNSAEHETLTTHKCQNSQSKGNFGQTQMRGLVWVFFLLEGEMSQIWYQNDQ